ncbi:hypothetical protein [Croceicoccus naphthovorans]|uniref:Uncharacterized protein n=1 Tax=Croceicoccus naphthovorans TaxID=1348774 RepID=A0A0G3XG52_9SPHN|nr:hypothetical protein [Croceicoccus naphthovorans]AKM09373.1 hypothetical protein AB433_04240 [Croceicoccus naphthovorans]MBB3990296.1 hypothetical protein [Croceicoccus naphthovorans]
MTYLVRLKAAARAARHLAHRGENPAHLIYFAGVGVGVVDYHMAAVGCLALGIVALLPEGV